VLEELANSQHITIEQLSRQALDEIAVDANHQGVIAYCLKPEQYAEADIPGILASVDGSPFILILDNVQDPHNLGACFRSADAAGVHLIIAPKDKSVGITPTVAKVACGAVETVPFVQVTNLARALEKLKEMGVWLYGFAGEATESLYQAKLTGPIALVLGAEGEGLRRLTRESCDVLVKIPMHGTVSSLNVSVAAGICLFEAARQRIND
jgi:23S rRNA (guanosine2251-2'-O)-methyltransferase